MHQVLVNYGYTSQMPKWYRELRSLRDHYVHRSGDAGLVAGRDQGGEGATVEEDAQVPQMR